MAGLKPMGYIVTENVRTETNGIIKKGEGAVKFYSGRKWQYTEKQMGLTNTQKVAVKFYIGWNWQESIQWDY